LIIDASVWVSRLVPSDANHTVSERWLTRYVSRGEPIILPATMPVEVAGAIARRTNDEVFARSVVAELVWNPLIELVEVSREVSEISARVAARLRLRGMDAIYVALAESRGIPLITWDEDILFRAARAIDVAKPS
jgi:predicted nucleic acid-binding protein